MTQRTLPWHDSLTDSVYALGAAARECQTAYQAAVIAKKHVDLDRIKLLDGQVDRRHPGYTTEQEPHFAALSRIGTIQLKTQQTLQRLYEETALAYAHGANWAVRQVRSGEQPARVAFAVDTDSACEFGLLPELQLGRYAGEAALERARSAYERCLAAGAEAEDIGRQAYIADHEANTMHAALDVAVGLADAAYAYGVQAERALTFALTTRASA
ncbi:hypothetical protein [Streptomyces reticuli]|uniref:hypothetical protein n=1 Tax=Streptomyces reticuli TaxID=1926 RepID=UPI00073DD657|nr:hypothetical protein [Streptomyces sp. SID7810]CUW29658.1 hypothetical protein TUE45_04367 [Streptomyces reticuli]